MPVRKDYEDDAGCPLIRDDELVGSAFALEALLILLFGHLFAREIGVIQKTSGNEYS